MSQPDTISRCREFLKDTIRQQVDFSQTDQQQGLPPPPIEKPYPADATRIALLPPEQWQEVEPVHVLAAIGNRQSHRSFRKKPLSLEELSILLWATQGIRGPVEGGSAYRTVPSAGCRHSLETYLGVRRVEGLTAGFYRYLPVEHELLLEFEEEQATEQIAEAAFGQSFLARAAVVFLWTTIPYRMEWRYGAAAHRVIALDAGHVCQNLYLACEAIGAGACAIAAYNQQQMDRLLQVDGQDEFTIYLAPVGKVY